VLHGRPHDYTLADGDLLTLDLAVSKGGVVADSAISFIVGDSKPSESAAMISATERALSAGIGCVRPPANSSSPAWQASPTRIDDAQTLHAAPGEGDLEVRVVGTGRHSSPAGHTSRTKTAISPIGCCGTQAGIPTLGGLRMLRCRAGSTTCLVAGMELSKRRLEPGHAVTGRGSSRVCMVVRRCGGRVRQVAGGVTWALMEADDDVMGPAPALAGL
jgi:hypothetical protein